MADPRPPKPAHKRLDKLLVDLGHFSSREKATFSIRAGGVAVDGCVITKPAAPVAATARVDIDAGSGLRIGRGERKLAGVLEQFGIDCAGKTALDVGSGAGGFTWQLLQHGAQRVYAVDVGSGQLHEKLRIDPRVVVYEQTDIRGLVALPEKPCLAAIDVSFISLRLVLPHVCTLLSRGAEIVALLKPQFESDSIGKEKSSQSKREAAQQRIRADFATWCHANSLVVVGEVESPMPGKHGNREIFFHLTPGTVWENCGQ